jgi:HAD superfamily hydrolase (TIGR01549 family)
MKTTKNNLSFSNPNNSNIQSPDHNGHKPSEKIEIVIPIYGHAELVRDCVESVLKTEPDARLILVDDCTPGDAILRLFSEWQSLPNITLLRTPGNQGFIGASRLGASAGSAPFILFLNSDTRSIQANWLEKMLPQVEDIAVVGAKLIHPPEMATIIANTIQHAGIALAENRVPYHPFLGWPQDAPEVNLPRFLNAVTGACMLVRRKVWDELGGWDNAFGKGVYEDVDFCWRVRKKGYRIYYQPAAQVYHKESASKSLDGSHLLYENKNENLNLLIERWQDLKSDETIFLTDDQKATWNRAVALMRKANQHQSLGEHSQTEELIAQAAQIAPFYLPSALKYGKNLYKSNLFEESLQVFEQISRIRPHDWEIRLRIIELLIILGRPLEAGKIISQMIPLFPKNQALIYHASKVAQLLSPRQSNAMDVSDSADGNSNWDVDPFSTNHNVLDDRPDQEKKRINPENLVEENISLKKANEALLQRNEMLLRLVSDVRDNDRWPMINLQDGEDAKIEAIRKSQPGTIAVMVHLFYLDLIPEIFDHLKNIPFSFDLYVSICDEKSRSIIKELAKKLTKAAQVDVRVVPNRGRDIAPLLVEFAPEILKHDFVCHIHSKKSKYSNGVADGWREYLLENLLGSPEIVTKIFAMLSDRNLGLVYPKTFDALPHWAHTWLSDREIGKQLFSRLGVKLPATDYFDYPVGSMFWARVDALKPLFDLKLTLTDFPQETGQIDGTLAHAIERSIALVCQSRNYRSEVISLAPNHSDLKLINSFDRIEKYFDTDLNHLRKLIDHPSIKVVSFDLFDTILVRPFLYADSLFDLLSADVNRLVGKKIDFKNVRIQADRSARARLAMGKDLNIRQIYAEFAALLNISLDIADQVMELEISSEIQMLRPRASMVKVMEYAHSLGKRVILVSDMYLSKDTLTDILARNEIEAYDELYVSSEVGLRKDTGQIWKYICEREGVHPCQILHIGDNEVSDIQIPIIQGVNIYHIMKPSALLQATRAGTKLFADTNNPKSLSFSASLGLVANKLFDHPFPTGFMDHSIYQGNPYVLGYAYYGPLILGFVLWLYRESLKQKEDVLYFLSREGEIFKKVYDFVKPYLSHSPTSKYLYLSRRSVKIPTIRTFNDILRELTELYFENDLCKLINDRFGFDLSTVHPSVISGCGFQSIYDKVAIPRDRDRIAYLLNSIQEDIYEQARKEEKWLRQYLVSEGIFDQRKKAVVDIGYSGSMQSELIRLIQKPMDGFYMLTIAKAYDRLQSRGYLVIAYLKDFLNPVNNYHPIYEDSLFYEIILTSIEGQVLNFEEKNGECRPVLRETNSETVKKELLPVIHNGIIDYARDAIQFFDQKILNLEFFQQNYHDFLANLLDHPASLDGQMLNGLTLDDTYCGNDNFYWEGLLTRRLSISRIGSTRYLPTKRIRTRNSAPLPSSAVIQRKDRPPEKKASNPEPPAENQDAQKMLRLLLNTDDLMLALEKYQHLFDINLLNLVRENVALANANHQEDLASGLNSLAEYIQEAIKVS